MFLSEKSWFVAFIGIVELQWAFTGRTTSYMIMNFLSIILTSLIYSITYISNFILFILVWLCQLCCEWIYIYNKCTVSNHGIDYKLSRKKINIMMLSVFCIIIKRLHTHDDVTTWQHLLHCWRFGWGIHWSQFYLFPSQCGTLVVSLLLAWTDFEQPVKLSWLWEACTLLLLHWKIITLRCMWFLAFLALVVHVKIS